MHDWHRVVAPDNAGEIKALEDDRGSLVGRREDVQLPGHITSVPTQYTKSLRSAATLPCDNA
jgi:hypothetical protein